MDAPRMNLQGRLLCALFSASLLFGVMPAGAQADFSAPLDLSLAGTDSTDIAVGASLSGTVNVAFVEHKSPPKVVVRRINANGSLGALWDVSDAEGDVYPDIATSPGGDSVVAWQVSTDAIKARRISAGGSMGPVQTLSGPLFNSGDAVGGASVAIDPKGNAVVAWGTHNVFGSPPQPIQEKEHIEARRMNADGSLGPIRDVGNAIVADNPCMWPCFFRFLAPEVAVDPNGNATVVWNAQYWVEEELRAGQLKADGSVRSDIVISSVYRMIFGIHDYSVQVGPNGKATFVWSEDPRANGDSGEVRSRAMQPSGSLGFITLVSANDSITNYASASSTAIDGFGNILVGWHNDNWYGPPGEYIGTRARWINAWGFMGPGQDVPLGASGKADVAVSVFGRGIAAASGDAVRIEPNGSLGPVQRFAPVGEMVNERQAVMDQRGHATVVWTTPDGSIKKIRAARD